MNKIIIKTCDIKIRKNIVCSVKVIKDKTKYTRKTKYKRREN